MRISTLLSLAGLAAAAPAPTPVPDSPPTLIPQGTWSGVGQIRAQWNQADYTDLGCLTDAGLWTTNEKLCGTFLAKPYKGSSVKSFTLYSAKGSCKIYGATLNCGPGDGEYIFGIWPWPNSIPNVESLRYGQYGLMATWGHNPPAKEEGPQEIHFVSYREEGKYVWLTWAGLGWKGQGPKISS